MKKFCILLTLLTGFMFFGQTAAAQSKCNEPIRKVIWRTLDKDTLKGPWDCQKVLRTEKIKSGKLEAILVRGNGSPFCGATGNCSTWLLNKGNKKWQMMLNAGSVIQWFEIKPRHSTGYPNLVFRGRMGASDHFMGLYRFNGTKYALQSCRYETYDIDGKRSVTRAARKYCSN